MTNTRSGGGRRIPLYRQVESELLRRIREQELRPGQRLPTEPELAAEWGVNRLTIRQAISELARAGAVVVRQGAGTYVAEPPLVIELDLPAMPSTDADAGSTASIAEYVQQDQTETLINVTDQDATRTVMEALEVDPPFVRFDTLVRTGQQPYLVSSYWLELRRFPDLADLFADRLALFQVLQQRYDLRLQHSWRSLTESPLV